MVKLQKFQENVKKEASTTSFHDNPLVFGEGNPKPMLMMIGEAPGADEVKQGRPFVGKAGKNLSAFLEVVELTREEIYISNVVKLRPTKPSKTTGKPVNRPPSKEEIAFFLPHLQEEIKLVSPQVIVTLGNVPLKAVTGKANATIGEYHAKPTRLPDGRMLFALYHPASIIYNRALSEVYEQDLIALKAFLELRELAELAEF